MVDSPILFQIDLTKFDAIRLCWNMNRIIRTVSTEIGINEASNFDGLSSMFSSQVYSFLILLGTDKNHINCPTAYIV